MNKESNISVENSVKNRESVPNIFFLSWKTITAVQTTFLTNTKYMAKLKNRKKQNMLVEVRKQQKNLQSNSSLPDFSEYVYC